MSWDAVSRKKFIKKTKTLNILYRIVQQFGESQNFIEL